MIVMITGQRASGIIHENRERTEHDFCTFYGLDIVGNVRPEAMVKQAFCINQKETGVGKHAGIKSNDEICNDPCRG